MKLALKAEKDIQILNVSEAITVKDIQVLKAGITKLFKNGKNKFLLNFVDAQDLPGPILHELALFEVLARELSGKIVLVSSVAAVQGKIKDFMKPPLLEVFPSVELGIKAFAPKPEPKKEAPKPAVQTPAPAKPTAAAAGVKPEAPKEPGMFKEQIKHREINELGPLRKQIEKLEAENKLLKDKILDQLFENRKPQDTGAAQARIQTLEEEIKKLLDQAPAK